MDPRRVLTFRAVARERSFSAAARSLALTQPAVSQQVSALEKEVGTRLLDREPGGLRLTRAGELLLEHADAFADRLALAERQLAELGQQERTRLRIGGFPSALATLVPKAVVRMAARGETRGGVGPGSSEVLVVEGDTVTLAERVRSGELHLAVGFQDAAQPRREHDGTERRDLAALADEPWVAPSGEGVIARSCAAAGFEMRLVMISRDPLANRALIAQGLAVTLVPRMLGAEFEGVELRPLEGGGPERDVYTILPPGGGRHPLVEPTLAALAEVASELA
jgi:DNA-binding transcriptional LysR family regulator